MAGYPDGAASIGTVGSRMRGHRRSVCFPCRSPPRRRQGRVCGQRGRAALRAAGSSPGQARWGQVLCLVEGGGFMPGDGFELRPVAGRSGGATLGLHLFPRGYPGDTQRLTPRSSPSSTPPVSHRVRDAKRRVVTKRVVSLAGSGLSTLFDEPPWSLRGPLLESAHVDLKSYPSMVTWLWPSVLLGKMGLMCFDQGGGQFVALPRTGLRFRVLPIELRPGSHRVGVMGCRWRGCRRCR